MHRIGRVIGLFVVFVSLIGARPGQAQGANLLQNPGMENPYLGQGASDRTAPTGWSLWFSGTPVVAYPHTDQYQIHGGAAAWNMRASGVTFTAGGFQQVPGVRIGSTIRATVYAQSYTCNNQTSSCIGGDGKHHSDAANAVVKIGIDPSGGSDPNAGQIVWSPLGSALDAWTPLTVDAINCNSTVTLFMYTTQSVGMFINSVYWDDASLSVLKDGTGTAATCGAAPPGVVGGTPIPTAPALAPFVAKQDGLQPDGSIIHIVKAGDTLAAIGVAYKVTLDDLRALNKIQPGDNLLKIGQKIIVRGPTPDAVPTGAIAPTSGSVVAAPTSVPTVTPISAVTAVAAAPTNAAAPANPAKANDWQSFQTFIGRLRWPPIAAGIFLTIINLFPRG